MANAVAAVEMARVDASLATFSLVHNFLALITIGLLGSEEQKRAYLPDMAKYAQVRGGGSWGPWRSSSRRRRTRRLLRGLQVLQD
jgi:alkylation response protein AidB-like acyl-CoA dehydrogenase